VIICQFTQTNKQMEVVKIQGLISKFSQHIFFLSLMVLEVLEKLKGHRVPDMQRWEVVGQQA